MAATTSTICPECGNPFAGERGQRFCSLACYHASTRMKVKPAEKVCTGCGVALPYTREFFAANRSKRATFGLTARCKRCAAGDVRERNKTYNRRLRIEALTAYGNGTLACVCCGEAHPEFLTIDHVNGGGRKEREHTPTQKLYFRLRRLGYPQGEHRTLCFNCNYAYGRYGCCPHRKGDS